MAGILKRGLHNPYNVVSKVSLVVLMWSLKTVSRGIQRVGARIVRLQMEVKTIGALNRGISYSILVKNSSTFCHVLKFWVRLNANVMGSLIWWKKFQQSSFKFQVFRLMWKLPTLSSSVWRGLRGRHQSIKTWATWSLVQNRSMLKSWTKKHAIVRKDWDYKDIKYSAPNNKKEAWRELQRVGSHHQSQV